MRKHSWKLAPRWALVAAAVSLSACVSEPPQPMQMRQEVPQPDTTVYFYPAQAQAGTSAAQQDRDKYECNDWAVKQTGFDPSVPNVAPHQRIRVVAEGPPPGTGIAVGAVTGAIVGTAISNPRHGAGGTLIGALAGAAIGGIADAEQANRLAAQQQSDVRGAESAALEKRAVEFRRAITACLEGRGYSVR